MIPLMPGIYASKTLHSTNVIIHQKIYTGLLEHNINAVSAKLALLKLTASKETLAELHARLGLMYLLDHNNTLAMSNLEHAVELVPDNYLYHYYMCLAYAKFYNKEQMLVSLDKAIATMDYVAPERNFFKKSLFAIGSTLHVLTHDNLIIRASNLLFHLLPIIILFCVIFAFFF